MKKQLLTVICLLLVVILTFAACVEDNKDDNRENGGGITLPTPSDSSSTSSSTSSNSGGNGGDPSTKTQYRNYAWSYFDTVTTIQGYVSSSEEFDLIFQDICAELEIYHKLYDIYNQYSGMENLYTINKLYDGEHRVVTVDQKIIDMLLYAKELYNKTNGEMNIAMGSVLSIWHDYRSAAEDNYGKGELPPMELLQEAAKHTDINDLIIDEENRTVYIADPKMTLDVGAIAKGYAVEMVAQMLEERGISGFVINVGGNIRTVGTKANGDKWLAGIETPFDDDDVPYLAYIGLAGEAIVTSGSYQRYYTVNGKRYHHIIDKDTLMPAEGFVSVSIICTSSSDGDGLSTALFCMSLEDGMALVNSLEGVEAHWVLPDGTCIKSDGFSQFEVEYNPK